MALNFQDDSREMEMIRLFELFKDGDQGRSGVDAFLQLDEKIVPFELKTTSTNSVSTVRDFGLNHIHKWRDVHWLFGFYTGNSIIYKYGSPAMMDPWISEKAEYINPDFQVANLIPERLTLQDLYEICGRKSIYDYQDAKSIQKNQYTRSHYLALQDTKDGYSPGRMLEILSDRAKYLIERGITLNNPRIPARYFTGWEAITQNHAKRLRELAASYFANKD